MNNCRIERNSGASSGAGGYFSGGTILMTNCVIASNTVAGATSQSGFGIYSLGVNLQLVDCLFSNNYGAWAARGAKGVALYFDNGTLRVLRTDFIGNGGDIGNGGAGGVAVCLGNNANTSASFSNGVFRGNVAP